MFVIKNDFGFSYQLYLYRPCSDRKDLNPVPDDKFQILPN